MLYGGSAGPMAIAHRGGAALAQENTLAAFSMATSLGFRYLETDVRVTRDGALVCFHDATVDRVTEGRGAVHRHSARALRSLRVFGGEPIPDLAEALEAFPDSCFTIDLKVEAAIEPLSRLLRNQSFAERVCVAGAWDGWLARLRSLVPGVQTALGWRSLAAFLWRSRTGRRLPRRLTTAAFAHVPMRLGSLTTFVEPLIEHGHGIGVRVVVWTVDEAVTMRRLLDVGVDGIITDRPDVLREVMVARGSWSPMGDDARHRD